MSCSGAACAVTCFIRTSSQFKEVFLTEHYLAVAMEYAAGGDMFQHVKRKGGLEEAEVRGCCWP